MNNDPQTYAIIGAAIEVHTRLGHGFADIRYKGQLLTCTYKVDFICFDEVLVELKALARLSGTEESQVINYLKASQLSRALLLDFGAPSLEHKRLVFTHRGGFAFMSCPQISPMTQMLRRSTQHLSARFPSAQFA